MVFIWGDSNIYKPTERTIDEERVPPSRMDIMVTGALAAATRQKAHQMHPAAVQHVTKVPNGLDQELFAMKLMFPYVSWLMSADCSQLMLNILNQCSFILIIFD